MKNRVFRLSNIFSWSLAFLLGAVLFHVSQSVQRAENQLRDLNHKVNLELEAIRVLEAEWAYLNAPTLLEDLAQSHLKVEELSADQVMDEVADIPSVELPVILKVKPVYVSSKVSASAKKEKSRSVTPAKSLPVKNVIQNADRQNFNSLLDSLTQEGAQ